MKSILNICLLGAFLINYSTALSQDTAESSKGFSLGIVFAPQFYNWHTTYDDPKWQ